MRILEGQHIPLSRRVRHVKTGRTYRVLTTATMEASFVPAVVYQSEEDGRVWVRPASEFIDGRFIETQ